MNLIPIFVENYIPEDDLLEDGKLYISVKYKTAIHKCPCGCKNKVVTPLNMWNLQISLQPSIYNKYLLCKSHYFIENNEIKFV